MGQRLAQQLRTREPVAERVGQRLGEIVGGGAAQ
jgi:hypothetical protein